MINFTRWIQCVVAAALPLFWISSNAVAQQDGANLAQDYPKKPIRWIIDSSAGSLSDILSRIVAHQLTELLGQAVVIDARPGANGIIAYEAGAKAAPDGYTLLLVSAPFTTNVSVYNKLPYDTRNDFAPVSLIATYPNVLVANVQVPAKNVAELITYAKAKPGGTSWASSGVSSSTFLAGELFRRRAGFAAVNVPYVSSPGSLNDMAGGRIDWMVVNIPAAMPFIRDKRIRAIGIASLERHTLLPDVPTIAESGLPGFESVPYVGAVFPAKVPDAIIEKLNAAIVRALQMPDVQTRIRQVGGEPRSTTPSQFKKYLEEDIERWAPVVRDAGVKLER
jgi:tripartite-type tricarboxylate transporter receptor subunit TctC